MPSTTIRSLSADETHLFTAYPPAPHPEVGREATQDYPEHLANGHTRPEWTWVARRDDVTVGRAAFWAPAGAAEPMALDWFEVAEDVPDRLELGSRLLAAAYGGRTGPAPEFQLVAPPGWRDRPSARDETRFRLDAALRAGMELFVERHGLTWHAAAGLPPRPANLDFRPAGDDEFEAVLRRTLPGSLDAHDRADLAAHGAEEAARDSLAFLSSLPGGRDRWRTAYGGDGELVGAVFPTRLSGGGHSIGYVAVVPERRGRGHVHELLAEAMHAHAEDGADRITAHTDLANTPMKAAFDRAGFAATSTRIDLRWSR